MASQLAHFAFLASRMDLGRPALNDLRNRIYELGEKFGQPVWVAERSAHQLIGQPPDQVQIACLRRVREIPEFICIVDGS